MKSFNNFYEMLPSKGQKAFKSEVMKACYWKTDDIFYKKMRGDRPINELENQAINKIIDSKYKKIFQLARKVYTEIDELLKNAI